jgi:hypothetical protein
MGAYEGPSLRAFSSLMVMTVAFMLRGENGRKLEAGDFTASLTLGRSARLSRLRRRPSRGIKWLSLAEVGAP